MRAAWYQKNGPAKKVLQIGTVDDPTAGPGEVRIRVMASGVNPSDVKLRAGLRQGMTYPLIIANSDGAGVIDQVGDGVEGFRPGQRVWLYNGQRGGRAFGTAAEYIALDAGLVHPLPDHVDFAEGACLGIPCMTAHRCVFVHDPQPGAVMMVTGGAGAVGHYAIQLAKWAGMTVLATVSGREKTEVARQAGADHVINYRQENVAKRVLELTGGDGVDHIVDVDFGGNLDASIEAIKNNGSISIYASAGEEHPRIPVFQLMGKNVALHFMVLNSCPLAARQKAQRDIGDWLSNGNAVHRIAGTFPLDEIAAAHELVESGSKNGTAIVLPQEA